MVRLRTMERQLCGRDEREAVFVKIPGFKSELFFNRESYPEASKLAEETGVGPKVAYFLEDSGTQIDEWLEGYSGLRSDRWIFQHRFEEKFLFKSLDALKKYHNSGKELPEPKDYFRYPSRFDRDHERV
jgi:hypothetical protein